MNQLIASNQITMSSREIASVVQSKHRDVCISIERLMKANAISEYAAMPYTHEQNKQTYHEYFISKRDSYVVVAQLSPVFTAALVDRWQELESQQNPAIPQTYAAALLEAGRLALEVEKQAEQLAIAAPKSEFFDKYVEADHGLMTFRAVCKVLGIKENEFRKFLSDQKIMYRLGGDWTPYQQHLDAGRFEVKAGLAEHEDSTHAYKQAKFTPKGVAWVAGEYAKHKVKMEIEK